MTNFSAVALDAARRIEDEQFQEHLAETILTILGRGFQVFLFSSAEGDNLADEDFQERRLFYLAGSPFGPQEGIDTTPLGRPETLWFTDDPALQEELSRRGLSFTYAAPRASIAGGTKLVSVAEIPALLDATAALQADLARRLLATRAEVPGRALLVGIAGPAESGYQQFALDLRHVLESSGQALVELMNLNLLLDNSSREQPPPQDAAPWVNSAARDWLASAVLAPLRAGRRVMLEHAPPAVPPEFADHLPLFLTEETVVIFLGEMLFVPEIMDILDVSVLLELTPTESTRRLYEMPAGESFDPKFTAQYLEKEGGRYHAYLEHNAVATRVDIRIDANRPAGFRYAEESPAPADA